MNLRKKKFRIKSYRKFMKDLLDPEGEKEQILRLRV